MPQEKMLREFCVSESREVVQNRNEHPDKLLKNIVKGA